jgi:hypothetical protein
MTTLLMFESIPFAENTGKSSAAAVGLLTDLEEAREERDDSDRPRPPRIALTLPGGKCA